MIIFSYLKGGRAKDVCILVLFFTPQQELMYWECIDLCQAAWFQLKNITSVRSCLTREATLRLVCSLVMPHLDYGNISLYGISEGLLDKLQQEQNAAARLVVKCSRKDHVTPHPVIYTGYQSAPAYISGRLTPYTPPRTLRSTHTTHTHTLVPTTHTKHSPVLPLGYGINCQ